MYALWALGRSLEPFLGRARFLAAYLMSGLGGGAAAHRRDQKSHPRPRRHRHQRSARSSCPHPQWPSGRTAPHFLVSSVCCSSCSDGSGSRRGNYGSCWLLTPPCCLNRTRGPDDTVINVRQDRPAPIRSGHQAEQRPTTQARAEYLPYWLQYVRVMGPWSISGALPRTRQVPRCLPHGAAHRRDQKSHPRPRRHRHQRSTRSSCPHPQWPCLAWVVGRCSA
jgi:hypothetical protein